MASKRIKVVCIDCGMSFDVGKTAYYNHNKNGCLQYRCKQCKAKYYSELNKIRWNDKTEKEKADFSKKMSDIYNQQTDEEKAIHREKSISYWTNMSDADKQRYVDNCKKLWNSRSEEYKIGFISNLQHNIVKWRRSLHEDTKDKIYKNIASKNKETWNSLSDEEKEKRIKLLKDERDRWWKNATMDQLIDHKAKSVGYWNSLSEEDKEKYRQLKIDEWNKKCDDDLIKTYFNTSLGKVNSKLMEENKSSTELDFISVIDRNNMKYDYQYMNYTYPDYFYEIFDKNKSPYHVWDFCIHTLNSDILIDIDGSEHAIAEDQFITKGGIDFGNKIQQNDAKRIFQTDGLEAFIVLAYNDIIEDNTAVYNITNNKFITFRDLMNYLIVMNISDDEFKKLKELWR